MKARPHADPRRSRDAAVPTATGKTQLAGPLDAEGVQLAPPRKNDRGESVPAVTSRWDARTGG